MKKIFLLTFCMLLTSLVSVHAAGDSAKWIRTGNWQGNGSSCTQKFWVNTNKLKVRYRPSGTGVFIVGLYNSEGKLVRTVTQSRGVLSGSSNVKCEKGLYYLQVTAPKASWHITIDQSLTVIEEWHLTKIVEKPLPPLVKLGTWTGANESGNFKFKIDQGSWKIHHENKGPGHFNITIKSEDGNYTVLDMSNGAGMTMENCWGHQPGVYELIIDSKAKDWKVEVFSEQAE